MRALVVDDDDLVRSNVAEVLSSEGWEVTEAASAERALELLSSNVWSLVFCDVRLSSKNDREGYDVLRSFTEQQPEAQIADADDLAERSRRTARTRFARDKCG